MVVIAAREELTETGQKRYRLVIKRDNRVVFYVELPDSSSESLFSALLEVHHPSGPGEPTYAVKEIVQCMPVLLNSYGSSSGQRKQWILSLAQAVDRFLDAEAHHDIADDCRNEKQLLKSFLYQFDVWEDIQADQHVIRVHFFMNQRRVLYWSLPLRAAERVDGGLVISQQEFYQRLSASPPEQIHLVMTHFLHFAEGLAPKTSLIQCYNNFAKALLELCEYRQEATFQPCIAPVCAFVVMVEQNDEEEKSYLESLVLHEPKGQARRQIFEKIVAGIDVSTLDGKKKQKRVINLISDHYLRLYDLEQAADFFDKICQKEWLYRVATLVYRHTVQISGLLLVPLCIVYLFRYELQTTSFLALFFLVPAYLLVIGFLITILTKKDIHYMRLIFPRLLGAIIIGLGILAPQDLPWKWGLIDEKSLILICAITYLGAFAYVYLEVETTLRPVGLKTRLILKTGLKIYLISLLEAILVTIVVTSLLSAALDDPTVLDDATGLGDSTVLGDLAVPNDSTVSDDSTEKNINDLYKEDYAFFYGSWAFYPSLVIVWAGIALFIAGFAQLLWQDKKITESI